MFLLHSITCIGSAVYPTLGDSYLVTPVPLAETLAYPDNILVNIGNADKAIEEELERHPSTTYEPRLEPSLPSDPIITVKSQPLPNSGLHQDLSNLKIRS